MNRSTTLLLPLLAPPLLLASGGGTLGSPASDLDQLYPGPLGGATFGKVVAGEFSGQPPLDLVVMAGGQPQLVVSPESYYDAIPLPGAANDFARLHDAGLGKDLVVTVGPSGLRVRERDAGQWVERASTADQTPWLDAERVATGSFDADLVPDIVGVTASGAGLVFETTSGQDGYAQSSVHASPNPIYGIEVLDWDGDGLDEVALMTTAGLTIRAADGSLVVHFPWSGGALQTAVVDDAGTSRQRIAFVYDLGGAQQFLGLCSELAGFEGPFPLGPAGVVGVSAADYGGDGSSELFLSVTSEKSYWMLRRVPGAPESFDVAAPVKRGYGPSYRDPANNRAELALGDFDSDGDVDVVAFLDTDTGTLPWIRGAYRLVRQGVNHAKLLAPNTQVVIPVDAEGAPTGELYLLFDAPQALLEAPPEGSTEWLVMLRNGTSFAMGSGVQAAPAAHVFQPLVAGAPFLVTLDLPPGFSIEASNDVLSVVCRQVALDAAGRVVAVGPGETTVYAARNHVELLSSFWASAIHILTHTGSESPTNPALGESTCDFTTPPLPPANEPSEPSSR